MPLPVGNASAALAAYRATGQSATAGGGAEFGSVLQRAVEGAVEAGHRADATSTQALSGQGSVTDVVLAVSRAELALQTAVAVRDRVVAAYQDVMRMPI
ncbi:flagellar hook-basal body complex protein FliE [Roseomonas sp. OT10]|uniref:flagellar hook-basal body complex protein FliE n=1 Tax=Roseomonas cutis TaxID=2897332 RepID=UPI001E38E85B|nr:flagellar hook-basal body complex protein FliE [Roseomonas sp. OT10]UFN48616.1 flagellar hook-basal body complex protein FliE [Roseomonas sp. OT10]